MGFHMSHSPPVLDFLSIAAATNLVERSAYLCDTGAAAFAVTLPLAATAGRGEEIEVIDGGAASSNNLTVTRSGADTIETAGAAGQTSLVITEDRRALRLRSDGISKWYVLGDTNDIAGESNTASNVGGGVGLFKQKAGANLEFKTLLGQSGIEVAVSGADNVTVKRKDSILGVSGNVASAVMGAVYKCDSGGGPFTVTLPAPGALTGEKVTVKDGNSTSSGANRVTIDTTGAETIDGKASVKLHRDEALTFESDGTNWMLV